MTLIRLFLLTSLSFTFVTNLDAQEVSGTTSLLSVLKQFLIYCSIKDFLFVNLASSAGVITDSSTNQTKKAGKILCPKS